MHRSRGPQRRGQRQQPRGPSWCWTGRQKTVGRAEKRLGNSLLLVSFWDVSCLLFLDALGCGDIKVKGCVYGGILSVIMSCELHHPGLPLITKELKEHVAHRSVTNLLGALRKLFLRWGTRSWHRPGISLCCFLCMWQISLWSEWSQPSSIEQGALIDSHDCPKCLNASVKTPLSLKKDTPA